MRLFWLPLVGGRGSRASGFVAAGATPAQEDQAATREWHLRPAS